MEPTAAVDVTEPDDQERTLGAVLGTAWIIMTFLGGGIALAKLEGTARTVAALLVGVPWLIGGMWWLSLYFRRVGRSYRAGTRPEA